MADPFLHDPDNLGLNREEGDRRGFGEFGLNLASVLNDAGAIEVHVFQAQGYERPIADAGQQGEGDYRLIAPLDRRLALHSAERVHDLVHRRHGRVAAGLGDAGFLRGKIEIVRVRITEPRAKSGLSSEPEKEIAERVQGRMEGGFAEFLAGPGAE